MKKREAAFTVRFRHWLKSQSSIFGSAAFELKQTTHKRLPYREVQIHQVDALMAAKHGFFLYKIPDDSQGSKPFDMVHFKDSEAYVVIKYPDFFVVIDIDAFIEEKENSRSKSLDGERAKQIAKVVVENKKPPEEKAV